MTTKQIEKMVSALRVIHTWATFEGGRVLNPKDVAKLTAEALKEAAACEPLPARDGYVIPQDVAVCPECGGRLYLTDDYDRTSPEPLPLDCQDEDWEDDDGVHRGWQSEWQPVIDKVRHHLNSHNASHKPQPPTA